MWALDLRGDFRVETGHLISAGLDSPDVKRVHDETTWQTLDNAERERGFPLER